jgi:uncharacterized membrane protein
MDNKLLKEKVHFQFCSPSDATLSLFDLPDFRILLLQNKHLSVIEMAKLFLEEFSHGSETSSVEEKVKLLVVLFMLFLGYFGLRFLDCIFSFIVAHLKGHHWKHWLLNFESNLQGRTCSLILRAILSILGVSLLLSLVFFSSVDLWFLFNFLRFGRDNLVTLLIIRISLLLDGNIYCLESFSDPFHWFQLSDVL